MGGGGAERVASILANGLVKDGYSVGVHTFVGGESFYPLSEDISITDCGIKKVKKGILRKLSILLNFPKAFFKTKKLIKKGGYDVVISLLPEADITVWLIRKFYSKFKWVSSERFDPEKRGKRRQRYVNKAYKNVDFLVCQSDKVKEYYSQVNDDKKTVIFNPININGLPERKTVPEKTIVSVGRLSTQKNFALLIKAFADISKTYHEYSLKIYGEGPERENLQNLIDELSAKEKITLCGADKNVLSKVASASLFVMTSNSEGFPNALLEAAAIGLPCISTDFNTGTACEIIDKDFLIPVGDEKALKERLEYLLSDDTLRITVGNKNRENAKKFDGEIIVKEWETLLLKVTENE